MLFILYMEVKTFIANYREAFGENTPLPLVFSYADEPIAQTEKTGGCFFKALQAARQGQPVSLHAGNIGCGGGKFYTGFADMPDRVPGFVSLQERYKRTPEMVLDFIRTAGVQRTERAYLNFMRVDGVESFDGMEGLLFFATPDLLSGLVAWTFYDTNAPDAVVTGFGSGCSTVVTAAVQENRRNGYRTFIGLFDPSVRPYVGAHELSFVIPACRFAPMYETMRASCLFGTHAWAKVRDRIVGSRE